MRIQYSCTPCGIFRVGLDVPDREHDEDVTHWVGEVVARAIGEDHSRRSPECRIETIEEMLIPIVPGSDALGRPAKN